MPMLNSQLLTPRMPTPRHEASTSPRSGPYTPADRVAARTSPRRIASPRRGISTTTPRSISACSSAPHPTFTSPPLTLQGTPRISVQSRYSPRPAWSASGPELLAIKALLRGADGSADEIGDCSSHTAAAQERQRRLQRSLSPRTPRSMSPHASLSRGRSLKALLSEPRRACGNDWVYVGDDAVEAKSSEAEAAAGRLVGETAGAAGLTEAKESIQDEPAGASS